MITTQALIAYPPTTPGSLNLKLEHVTLRELKDDEVLVKMLASGICHTDIVVGSSPEGYMNYPKVLGHEGTSPLMSPCQPNNPQGQGLSKE
jgi:D-arabinose 1-dehydrogenase-like Zn-dependent alcohol dehydrogenase